MKGGLKFFDLYKLLAEKLKLQRILLRKRRMRFILLSICIEMSTILFEP